MKITISTGIYPPSIGGPATYAKMIFDELPQRGIEVSVLSYDSVRHLPKGISHLVFFFKLLVQSFKSEMIYSLDPVSVGLPSLCVSKILNKKLIIRIAGDYAWEQAVNCFGIEDTLDDFVFKKNYNSKILRLKKIQSVVANDADLIIVPSNYLKKIVSLWGVDENKIRVINNSINPVVLKSKKERLDNDFKIISVGRLVSWKGFRFLIESFKKILLIFPNAKMYIAGSGPDEEMLQSLIKTNNLGDNVSLLGSLNKQELGELMQDSDLFILNTKYEGFSHTLLEAMTYRVPVITTNVCGNPEIIEDRISGLLFDYNDWSSLEKALCDIKKPNLRISLIDNAYKKVAQFTKQKMLNELTAEINKII